MFKRLSPQTTQKLVEEQVRKWQLDSKASDGREKKPPAPWPLITLSREFGTLGAAMGQLVAEKLGFRFWDQEIVHAIAEQTGAQETLLASLDERSRNRIEDFISESLIGAEGTVAEYVRQVARVVRTKQTNSEYTEYSTRVTCVKSNHFLLITLLTIHNFWPFRSIRSLKFVWTLARTMLVTYGVCIDTIA